MNISQLTTLYYLLFFVILPLLSRIEKAKPLPTSIYAAVTSKAAILLLACAMMIAPLSNKAIAAEDAPTPPHQEWSFDGITGTYDKAAMQRGFQVYKEVCAACHSMDLLSYRNLTALGYNEEQVKAIASEYTVMDGPNDEGEMFSAPPSNRPV